MLVVKLSRLRAQQELTQRQLHQLQRSRGALQPLLLQAAADPELLMKLQWQFKQLDILEKAIRDRARFLENAEDRVLALLREMDGLLDSARPAPLS